MMRALVDYLGRIVTFLALAVLVTATLYFQYFTPPFAAIPSRSMEPLFQVGTLILVEKINPMNIKAGDIIVVDVPAIVQDRYNYPASIVHRVVKVNRLGPDPTFRIKGDNNPEEDPFTVLPEQVAGTVKKSIPYAGYAVLFLHSKQGFYFILSLSIIYVLYVLSEKIEQAGRTLKKGISALIFADVLSRMDEMERTQERSIQRLEQVIHEQNELIAELVKQKNDYSRQTN